MTWSVLIKFQCFRILVIGLTWTVIDLKPFTFKYFLLIFIPLFIFLHFHIDQSIIINKNNTNDKHIVYFTYLYHTWLNIKLMIRPQITCILTKLQKRELTYNWKQLVFEVNSYYSFFFDYYNLIILQILFRDESLIILIHRRSL